MIHRDSELRIIGREAFLRTSIESIFIPCRVTKICKDAFSDCKSLHKVEFDKKSELEIIEKGAFKNSVIRSISIPSKVIKLEEGWCSNTVELKSVTVSRNNPNFISIDDKFIFGKKDENSDDFEVLVFACRDIKEYKIPPNITRIASNAFESSSIFSFCD